MYYHPPTAHANESMRRVLRFLPLSEWQNSGVRLPCFSPSAGKGRVRPFRCSPGPWSIPLRRNRALALHKSTTTCPSQDRPAAPRRVGRRAPGCPRLSRRYTHRVAISAHRARREGRHLQVEGLPDQRPRPEHNPIDAEIRVFQHSSRSASLPRTQAVAWRLHVCRLRAGRVTPQSSCTSLKTFGCAGVPSLGQ
jgi:hypothetical protein